MAQATGEAGQEQGLADQASAKVQDVAAVAQEKASELREHGSARLRDQFDRRSRDAGLQVRSLAEALRRSGNDLSDDGNRQAAQLAGQAADRVERLGTYLEQKGGEELVRDVEGFARRRPWLLAGLGMLAGVAAARFVKASSEQRYGDYRRINKQQWPTGQGTAAQGGGYGRGLPSALSDGPVSRDPYAGTR